jgi:uncharacterized protein (TIGR03546 family)
MLPLRKIRKIVALIRGQVSPSLTGIAVGLGIWFGLMPGFFGIHWALLILLVLLNLPIGLFILSTGIGKALCYAGAPLLYKLGLFTTDHFDGLFTLLKKVPILAITDFSRPALNGALIAGPVIGAVLGLIMGMLVLGFRKTWLKLQEKSDKFSTWQEKKWVRAMDRIVVGKRAKDIKAVLEAKTKYIRKAGVFLAVLLALIFWGSSSLMKGKIKDTTANNLSQRNGATVDIGGLTFSPVTGEMSVTGLGIADTNNLNINALQIKEISSKADVYQLSLGKVVMDEVRVSSVRFDQARATAATRIIVPGAEDPNDSDPSDPNDGIGLEDLNKLEAYFEKAKQVKAWIEKIKPWLPSGDEAPSPLEEPRAYLDYLTARIDPLPAVRLLAKQVFLDEVQFAGDQFGQSNIQLQNLSDAPIAAKLPIVFDLVSQLGPKLNMTMHFEDANAPGKFTGSFEGIDLATLQQDLKPNNDLTFQGGKAAGQIAGFLNRDRVDLQINANLSQLKAGTQGKGLLGLDAKTTQEVFDAITDLDVAFRLVGPLTSPRLSFDSKGLQETLLAKAKEVGKEVVKEKATKEINRLIDKELGDKIPEEAKDLLNPDTLKDGLKGLFGGKKKKD